MKKFFKAVADFVLFLLTGKDDEAVNAGICDYSGQGRDKYGR